MRIGLVTIAYNEQRFVKPFLEHIPEWVNEKLVLVSSKPWQGEFELPDKTDEIARDLGATVIVHDWPTEEEQRNAGQFYFHDCDWIIVLDPDEFLDRKGWNSLRELVETGSQEAYVVEHQRVFYKNKEVSPHTDYQQIVLVKPSVRFTENRVVNCGFGTASVDLFHFSWARTNKEVWSKISHYSHADEMDIKGWYKDVWLKDKTENLHPMSPETLKALIPAKLPVELARLNLWPKIN